MALSGSLKDFAFGDILQLIGMQRKTGLLTLTRENDSVTVRFLDGRIVGADTNRRSVEDLLGSVLVRTGRVTRIQLQEALKVQADTLQRLGHVLVQSGYLEEADLVEALSVQTHQMIYRLFRWREGQYEFRVIDDIEYDERHFQAIDAETVLMEGARMVDEWPLLERKIRSDTMVFRKAQAALRFEPKVQSIVDADLPPGIGEVPRPRSELGGDPGALFLSDEERQVLKFVDGQRTVGDIVDRVTIGEFDTHRTLVELLTRQLIEEVRRPTAGDASRERRRLPQKVVETALYLVLAAWGVGCLMTQSANPFSPGKWIANERATGQLRREFSRQRLERLDEALRVFILDRGFLAPDLEELARAGYVHPANLLDAWDRPFGMAVSDNGYRLFGVDAEGRPAPGLSMTHRFTAVERMMIAPRGADTAALAKPSSGS